MVTAEPFGRTAEGKEVFQFHLEDDAGNRAVVLNYGAVLQQLWVAGRDVCLGYDTLVEYEAATSCFGSTMGRCTGRIADRKITLSGKTWLLSENRENLHMHGGFQGFHKKVWDWEILENGVRFTYLSPHGEEGYPGNLTIHVTYRWADDGVLELEYDGCSDAETVINLTNHSYFNLDGHDSGDAMGQRLQIFSDSLAKTHPGNLPTGEVLPVVGTALDFTAPHILAQRIDDNSLAPTGGYDHNYILPGKALFPAAKLWARQGDLSMEVWTDLPDLGLYTANFLPEQEGKGGCRYGPRHGVCLETQYIPNGANLPHFSPIPVFPAGARYHHFTQFRFCRDL